MRAALEGREFAESAPFREGGGDPIDAGRGVGIDNDDMPAIKNAN
jgi:hypothetical protein